MSTSSRPEDYSITSIDTITLNSNYSGSTITIDPSYTYTYSHGAGSYNTMGAGSHTISGLSTCQINTISSINIDDFKIAMPEEWVNCLPDFDRIEKMCKLYPGLAIAFEKFKTTYKLVKDDYDTPKDQRPRP